MLLEDVIFRPGSRVFDVTARARLGLFVVRALPSSNQSWEEWYGRFYSIFPDSSSISTNIRHRLRQQHILVRRHETTGNLVTQDDPWTRVHAESEKRVKLGWIDC